MSILNETINKKCYCDRRKLWGKGLTNVRKPMSKNLKKQSDTQSIEEAPVEAKRKKSETTKKHKDRKERSPKKCLGKRKRSHSASRTPCAKKIRIPESPYKRVPSGHPKTGGKRPKSIEDILAIKAKEKKIQSEASHKKKPQSKPKSKFGRAFASSNPEKKYEDDQDEADEEVVGSEEESGNNEQETSDIQTDYDD